ncbi:hypothetical protein MW887_004012 [Aspergillus wentii]|nr:hypothetical protein MW887_004012 [Aspergillus wentii]
MHQSTRLLAGCLGLDDGQQVFDLLYKDPATKPLLEEWCEHRRNHYGTSLSVAKLTIQAPVLLALAQDPKAEPIITSDIRPELGEREGRESITADWLAPLTCLWYLGRIIAGKPQLFPSSVCPSMSGRQGFTLESHLNPYDVLHGWKLLTWATRQSRLPEPGKKWCWHRPAIQPSRYVRREKALDG